MSKRRKILSILVIPDGEQQTFTLKIRYGLMRFVFALLVVFLCVLIFGTISYWKLAKIALDYNRVEALNEKLLKDNEVINQIAENYTRTREIENRIRNILGDKVDFSDDSYSRTGEEMLDSGSKYVNPLHRQYTSRSPLTQMRSDLLSSYPTLLPVDGPITRFFSRNNAASGAGHFGIDLVAQELSVIRASGDGIVVFAGWTVDGGNELLIDHQNGYMTIYKHNASLLVQERQFVRQGDPVALLGNSGESTAPHLHFEVWKDYKPIDPFEILPIKDMEPLNVRN